MLEKQWVETWQRAGPEMERIRRNELRSALRADQGEIGDSLLQIACRDLRPRVTSGLTEQQRLFQRLFPLAKRGRT